LRRATDDGDRAVPIWQINGVDIRWLRPDTVCIETIDAGAAV
jgi:hypothetical protein